MNEHLEKGAYGLAGAAILGAVPALWHWFTGASQRRQGWLEAELVRERQAKETVISKLEIETVAKVRAQMAWLAIWTSWKARHPEEADPWEVDAPTGIRPVIEAIKKDPFQDLANWDPEAKTPG